MLKPGTILQGRYRVERQLARGGMGTVYEARDERLDAVVALKETSFEDEDLRRAFEREARLLARLEHPALPRVSDHFTEDDGQFLVMQFVAGPDIEEMRRHRDGGSFPPAQVLAWADQLLDALEYLHTQQPPVIHRDIKPQNLKLGSRGQIILLDFGLAKGYSTQTTPLAASVVGYTPAYAPLEQIQGAGTDERSDLYSLAATLYHLMTGATPLNALARADAVLNGQPDPLRPANELNPDVSPEVAAVLRQAMALRRDQRLSSAAAMRRALREADKTPRTLTDSSSLSTVVMTPVHSTPPRRPLLTQALKGLFVLGLIALAGFALVASLLNNSSRTTTTANSSDMLLPNTNAAANTPTAITDGDKIGVPECDDYLAKYEACVNAHVPEAARATFKSSMNTWRNSWKQLARTQQGRAGLVQACKAAANQANQTFRSYGCSW